MTTKDLIARLRACPERGRNTVEAADVLEEQAKEIERLRLERKEIIQRSNEIISSLASGAAQKQCSEVGLEHSERECSEVAPNGCDVSFCLDCRPRGPNGECPHQQVAPKEPNNDEVICPQCCHQFRAIPVNVQKLMLDAGFEPPFTEAAPAAPKPLTDDEIQDAFTRLYNSGYLGRNLEIAFARAIEAAHGITQKETDRG